MRDTFGETRTHSKLIEKLSLLFCEDTEYTEWVNCSADLFWVAMDVDHFPASHRTPHTQLWEDEQGRSSDDTPRRG